MKARHASGGTPVQGRSGGTHWVVALMSALAVLASGCRTKPPPTGEEIRQSALPQVVMPQAWKAASTPEGAIQDDWLASFEDAQLTALAKEAVSNNPDLRVAAIRIEQANNYLDLARAALRPAVNIFGTGGVKAGGGGDLTGALQGIMLGVSWEPDLWGKLRYARNAADEVLAATRYETEFARQSLAATVAKSWFTATETLLQGKIAEDTVQAGQALVNIAEQRAEVGAASEQEVALARANLGGVQDSLLQIQLAQQQAVRAIELLLGRYPSAELQARSTLTAPPAPVPAGMPLQMLERRPDMLAAEHRVAVAFNQVGEARGARLPKIVLNASFGALDSDVLQLKQDFSNPTAGAGARLAIPAQKEAVAQYAGMALRAIGDVENALAAGQNLSKRVQVLEQVVSQQQRGLQFAQDSFRVGKQDLRTVQQQQLTLYSARIALLRVRSEQLSQRVNLYLALGGSFERSDAATPVAQR